MNRENSPAGPARKTIWSFDLGKAFGALGWTLGTAIGTVTASDVAAQIQTGA